MLTFNTHTIKGQKIGVSKRCVWNEAFLFSQPCLLTLQ